MLNSITEIHIFYKNIFLTKIKFKNKISIRSGEDIFQQDIPCGFTISKPNIFIEDLVNCNITESYLFDNKLFGIPLSHILKEEDKRIIKYINILEFLSDSDFIDRTINCSNGIEGISFSCIIAQRNLEILKSLFAEYQNSNMLLCSFLLRDIIENIKLYLHFIRGAKREQIIKNEYGTFVREIVSKEIDDEIINALASGNRSWNFNIKNIINNNKSLHLWLSDLKTIERINRNCNNTIHKLGLSRILPRKINAAKNELTLQDIFFCIRFFITLIVCYDGKELSSSDYIDYLDCDMEPPINSQYWIASICKDFIDSEYTEEEIKKLKEMTYMDLDYCED